MELFAKFNVQTNDVVSIDYNEIFKGIVVVSKTSVQLFGGDGSKRDIGIDQNFEHEPISKGIIFQSNDKIYLCVAFEDGSFIVEPVGKLLNQAITVDMVVTTRFLTDAITFLGHLPCYGMLAVGSSSGQFATFSILPKVEPYQWFDFDSPIR